MDGWVEGRRCIGYLTHLLRVNGLCRTYLFFGIRGGGVGGEIGRAHV